MDSKRISQVLPLESYAALFAALVGLPASTRHLTLVATVPIVYPHILGSHKMMLMFGWLYHTKWLRPIMTKTGASAAIMNKFGGLGGGARAEVGGRAVCVFNMI
ncbi:hypothetical protein GPECTOR_50g664 [Gonium pectorale]|uniref:Uncharacterized protein n=1 Tax=Gonium pectorale TaxID=33097 RepID=A0A150G934_GONPE|nr:hypothetical protein GPECTOR_50g664 [Gonium pectorale]|eukprot:KXZ45870.1 hypothetical protein GPECTOR_50g664 [Gonium pectorale]